MRRVSSGCAHHECAEGRRDEGDAHHGRHDGDGRRQQLAQRVGQLLVDRVQILREALGHIWGGWGGRVREGCSVSGQKLRVHLRRRIGGKVGAR